MASFSDSFLYIPPGRCMSCNSVLGSYVLDYMELIQQGYSIMEALDQLKIASACCRGHFVSPIMHSVRYGPAQLASLRETLLEQQRDQTTELRNLVTTLKITDLTNYRELNQLAQFLFKSLEQFWGTGEYVWERLEDLINQPRLPVDFREKVTELENLLERTGLTSEDLNPVEAEIVTKNLRRLNRYDPDKTLVENYEAAEVPAHQLLRRPMVSQKFLPKANDRIRDRYREIYGEVQNFLPGYSFENLLDRIKQLQVGNLSNQFIKKYQRFQQLLKDLDFDPTDLPSLQRAFELQHSLIGDNYAMLEQMTSLDRINTLNGFIQDALSQEKIILLAPPRTEPLSTQYIDVMTQQPSKIYS